MASINLLLSICFAISTIVNAHIDLNWEPTSPAFDPRIYEDALDTELCEQQLEYIQSNALLRLQYSLESGVRFPRGFLTGNTLDLGNYYQCLGINHRMEVSTIQGKYCIIQGPIQQDLRSLIESSDMSKTDTNQVFDAAILRHLEKYSERKSMLDMTLITGKETGDTRFPGTMLSNAQFRVAVCVPKTCTTDQGMSGLLFNVSDIGLQFQEHFCRLPDDKPWVAVDYVTIAILSLIGLTTIASTTYDLWQTKRLKRDPKQVSTIYRSFSLYTNTKRLLTFNSTSGSLDCVDGVRALAMIWVIVGHAFSSQSHWSNPLDTYTFSTAFSSLWLTAAHLTVDTFFFLSGLLVVYTTIGKLNGIKLVKNIHLFYLNRLLRMFPILAVGILLEASIAHRISDGPDWETVAVQANRCRTMWWTTLLYIQNYVGFSNVCIGQTWYLAIDMQLHIIAPIVLVWVGSKRLSSWVALTAGLLLTLIGATVYNFVKDFPSGMMTYGRGHEMMYYMVYYYMNTLTRASPYFVGMISGYILHLSRGQKLKLSKYLVAFLWCCALVFSSFAVYMTYPPMQVGWANQLVDTLINSFQRPLWGICLGWMIFACVHGYGGPINWFLSLTMWKLPARLSYGMYILHFSIMTVVSRSRVAPVYFTVGTVLYDSLGLFALSFIAAFVAILFIDSPCSTLFKLILEGGLKKPKQQVIGNEAMKEAITANVNGVANDGFNDEEKVKET